MRSSGSTDSVTQCLRTRDRHFRNAEAMLGGREPRKASEMLWGAVAQGVKALAASRSLSIQPVRTRNIGTGRLPQNASPTVLSTSSLDGTDSRRLSSSSRHLFDTSAHLLRNSLSLNLVS